MGLFGIQATFSRNPFQGGMGIITYQATFGEDEAGSADDPMDWYEWTIRNGTGPKGNICLNRRVEYMGTKAGGVWIARVTIGFA